MESSSNINCNVCGKSITKGYLRVRDNNGKTLYNLCLDCSEQYKMITGRAGSYPDLVEIKRIIQQKARPHSMSEHRIQCNACGAIFCYSDEDVKRNKRLKTQQVLSSLSSVLNFFAVSGLLGQLDAMRSDQLKSQIIDYSKCPRCNSTDLREF